MGRKILQEEEVEVIILRYKMKNIIIVNQAPHGIGPILRAAEFAQDLYHMLKKDNPANEYEIVFTEPEKPFLKKVLQNETFLNDEALEHVWLSPEFGALVNSFDFSSSDYKDRLENIAANRSNLEAKLLSLLENGMEAYKLVKPEERMAVKSDNLLCEVSHNPILRTAVDGSLSMFYTTIGLFSEILKHASDVNPRYNDAELQKVVQACISEAKDVESVQTFLMVAEPSALTYKGNTNKNELWIPPFIRPPAGSTETLKQGVYLNISGIDSVQKQIVDLAKPFMDAGYAVYYPPSYKQGIEGGIEKAPVEKGISIFSNPAIIAAVGRMGWSSVWEPMMNGSPFITYEYDEKEDPEMHHNVRTLEQLGLGVVMKTGDEPKVVMEKALALRPKIQQYLGTLQQKYGTLNGIEFAAKRAYSALKGW